MRSRHVISPVNDGKVAPGGGPYYLEESGAYQVPQQRLTELAAYLS